MSDISSIALAGMRGATDRFTASAARVASDPNADLVGEIVAQKAAAVSFKANVAVLKTAHAMSKSLLDIKV